MTVHIENENPLIGDALGSYPFILHFAAREKTYVTGTINSLVKDVVYAPDVIYATPQEPIRIKYTLHPQNSLNYSVAHPEANHMAQGYFGQFQLAVPSLPIRLPLRDQAVVEKFDIIISPFSFSDRSNVKKWPKDKWCEFIDHYKSKYTIGVLGGPIDDFTPYIAAGAVPFQSRPLAEVYFLLKQAKVVVTVDTSINHMCHFGGISHHVLLFPRTLPRGFAESPLAHMVQQVSIHYTTVSEVIEATNKFLI